MPLTKDDLENIRTVVNAAVDGALDKRLTPLRGELHLTLRSELDPIRKHLAAIDKRFDQVLEHIDGFAGAHETLEQEFASLKQQVGELEKKVSQ